MKNKRLFRIYLCLELITFLLIVYFFAIGWWITASYLVIPLGFIPCACYKNSNIDLGSANDSAD